MHTIVLVTGGFDPLHEGHIAYFKAAKAIAMEKDPEHGELWVGLNSQKWLTRKKGKPFHSLLTRETIVANLKMVDGTITYDDDDNSSINAIKMMKSIFDHEGPHTQQPLGKKPIKLIFANGGDRTALNIPEMKWAAVNDPSIIFEFGVGGERKLNSSSHIILRHMEFPEKDHV